jgi:hypothetical protein
LSIDKDAVKGTAVSLLLPSKISVKAKREDKDRWVLRYSESYDYDMPKEDAERTMGVAKQLGVEMHKRGRTFSSKMWL